MPPIARLAQLVRQLTLAPSSAAGAGALPGDSQSAADEQARGEESALRLLSADQMADFVAKGYVLVQPKEGDELPSGFHANFYDRVDDLMRNPIHEGHRDLGLMTPQINTLLRTPSCHGALRSILGESFAIASWGNGTPLLHNPQDTDQRWHKDGTDHGNTQSTVRDALPRHVIMFYYAQDTTLDMGPTSIIPGSQYYSVDRLGAGSSEHSLATELYDNEDEDLARRDAGIQSAGAILSRGFEQAEALRQARIAGELQPIVSGTELLQEKKLTVKAGTLAIVHHDMFHRATRHTENCRWRPMIKMGAVRLVEPHLSTPPLDPLRFSGPGSELWGEVATWMGSDSITDSDPPSSATELIAHGCATTSETERLDDACALGRLCRAGSSGTMTISKLLALFTDEAERSRRFAFAALSRAGPAAVPGLQAIIATPPKMEGVTALTQAYSNKLLGQTSWDEVALDVHIAVDALYCLGQSTIAVEALTMDTAEWLAMAMSVIDCCGAAIERSSAELTDFIATRPPVEGEGLVFYALERRRMLAEACNTIGLVGAEAVAMDADGAAAVVLHSCELLHPLACMAKDEASVYANFMYATTVQTNAAQGLMRLCSVGGCSDAIVMRAPNSSNPESTGQLDFDNLVAGMVCEARDRLDDICDGRGKAGWVVTAAQLALRAKMERDLSWPWDLEAGRLYEAL